MESPETAVAAGESFLELFPEAAATEGLFGDDPEALGPVFADALEAMVDVFPVAGRVRAWAVEMHLVVE